MHLKYHKIEGLKESFLKEKVSEGACLHRASEDRQQDDERNFPLRIQMQRCSTTLSGNLTIRLLIKK